MALREMIVTCPACRTRYLVAEPQLGRPGGRTVRCANCGHTWRQEPAADRRPPEPPAIAAPQHIEPAPEIVARAVPNPAPAPEIVGRAVPDPASAPEIVGRAVPDPAPVPPAARRRHGWLAFGSLAILVLIVLAILVLIVGRSWVAAAWPPAARLYAGIGLPTEASGNPLKIGKITPSRTGDGLIIEGEVVNAGSTASPVPRLRVALQDGAGKEVQFKIVDPPKPSLQPGEAVHFRTPFEHPNDAATGVVVTFAPG